MSNLGQYTNNNNKNPPWGGGGGRTQNSAVGMVNQQPVPSPMQQQQQQMVLNQNALNNLNTSGMVHPFQQQQQQQQAFQNVIGLQHHQHQQNLAAGLGPLQQMANSAMNAAAAAGLGSQLTSTQLFQQVGAVTYPNTRGLNPTAFGTTAGPITGVPPVVIQAQNQQNSLNSTLNSLNSLNQNALNAAGSLTGQGSVGMANSVNKQRVFTGIVTKVHDNFGFVDEDVFFQANACVKGSHPMVGDRVLVEASYNPNMPFKWNATRIQVLPNTGGGGGGGGSGGNMSMNSGGPQSRSHGHHGGNQKNYNNNSNTNSSNAYNAVPPPNDHNLQHSNYSRNNQRSRGNLGGGHNRNNNNNNNRDRDRSPLNFMTVNRDRDRDVNSKGRDNSADDDLERKRRREERMREREKDSGAKGNKSPVRTRLRSRSRSRSPKNSRGSGGNISGAGGGGSVSLSGSGGGSRRTSRIVPRYMVQIPKIALNLPDADVLEIRRRYANLYIPSDFFHTNFRWVDAFPPEKPFALQNWPCTFHIMNKDVEDPRSENDAILEPPDADYLFSAKVMLMSMCSLDELYQKCCGVAAPSEEREHSTSSSSKDKDGHGGRDKDRHSKRSSSSSNHRERDRDRDRDSSEERSSDFVHPARLINFLVGLRGKNETMAIGGPWSPSLDGADPKNDPSVLIRTAIRTCKALTGIDLSNCTKWYRFVELYYRRRSSGSSSKGRDAQARVETVVIYLPDIWTSSCVPTRLEWDALQAQYKRALEARLLSKNVNNKSSSATTKVSTATTSTTDGGSSCQQQPVSDVKMSTSTTATIDGAAAVSSPQQPDSADAEAASDAEMPHQMSPTAAAHNDEKDEDPTSDVVASAATTATGTSSSSSSSQQKSEPTHYSQLDPKIMSFTALRDELNARNLNSKGLLKSQLIARLAKALKVEENEEIAGVDGEDRDDEDETNAAEKAAENDSASTTAPSVGASSKEKKSETEDSTTATNRKKSKMDDKERAILEKRYALPDQPQIIVHPSKSAKSGKFDCTLMSLSLLLDYRPEDTKEHSFEVSLFAELFNEMFMRDFGFNIYRALHELPEKVTEKEEKGSKKGDKEDTSGATSKKKDEDDKSEHKKKSDDTNNDKKKDDKDDNSAKDKSSNPKDDEKQSATAKSASAVDKKKDSGKKSDDDDADDDEDDEDQDETSSNHKLHDDESAENSTQISSNKEKQSEKDRDRESVHSSSTTSTRDRRHSSKTGDKDRKSNSHGQQQQQRVKMYTKNKQLLLSFIYFDQTHCGYIFDKDIEDLLYTLGLSLSRAQVKKLVGKVVTRDSLHYRKLTDAPKEVGDSATVVQDDGKTEKDNSTAIKTEWALGNKRLLPVFGREDTSVAKKRKLNSDVKEESAAGTAKRGDGPGGEDGLITYRGALVDVGKLMSQLERSEKARLDTESRMVNLKQENSKLSEKSQKSSSTIKHLTSDVKDVKEKLRNVEESLAKTQIQSKIYHNVLSDIREKIEPVLKSSTLSTAPKDEQQTTKKEKDRDSTGNSEREKERDIKKMADEQSKSRWERESNNSSATKDSTVKEDSMESESVGVVKTESQ